MAEEAGITKDELGAAQSVVMAVAAGRVQAQLREVRGRISTGGTTPSTES